MVTKHCPGLFSKISGQEYKGVQYLEAIIPHEDEKRIIRLSTYSGELTVFIHTHHCHFDQLADDNHQEEFESAIEWIRDLLNNRIFIYSEFEGDRLVAAESTYIARDVEPKKGIQIEVLTYSCGTAMASNGEQLRPAQPR